MERSQTTSPDSTKHLSGKATSSQPTSKQFKPARSSLASTILHSRQCSRLESEPTLTSPSSRTCPSNPRQRRGAGRLSRSRRRQKCPLTSSTWALENSFRRRAGTAGQNFTQPTRIGRREKSVKNSHSKLPEKS